ncbi:MAG TPA: hypothetical protein VM821_04315 [Abditibacteriaceae bacterium]|nr:hypothetical protein [Abditibacteriaceae bacterium]
MSSSRSYRPQQSPALRAKAVPMPQPHIRVLEIARTWILPVTALGWLLRMAWQMAM